MSERNFRKLSENQWADGKFSCLGLDIDIDRLPKQLQEFVPYHALKRFGMDIIDATHDVVGCYKPNIAFYEKWGPVGLRALHDIIKHSHTVAPSVPVILDGKRADIGNTNLYTVAALFDYFKADAATLNPYLGQQAVQPFLDCKDKGLFMLCKTSNPGSDEFQDLEIKDPLTGEMLPLYQYVARQIATHWNDNNNCGLVVGATYSKQLEGVRSERNAPELPILIPGVGTQGGSVEASVQLGRNSQGTGFFINSSSAILYASSDADYAEAARGKLVLLNGDIEDLV